MPNLIVLRGPVGAGKTTTMNAVSQSLENHTVLEVDALKRLIDPHQRSNWRRVAAHRVSMFMAHELLLAGRSVITEAHTRWPEQTEGFRSIAEQIPDTKFFSFLVTAPLITCIERASKRRIPGVTYPIDQSVISSYYVNVEPLANEPVIRTDLYSPQIAAGHIAAIVLQSIQ